MKHSNATTATTIAATIATAAAGTAIATGAAAVLAARRAAKASARQMWWQAQLRLTVATVQGPDHLLDAWGAWPDGMTADDKRVQLLMNALTTNTELGHEQGVLDARLVREFREELHSTEAGRRFWAQAADARRRTASTRSEQEFVDLLDTAVPAPSAGAEPAAGFNA